MPDLMSMTKPQLVAAMEAMGEKKFRAMQLYDWFHKKLVNDYDEMTNLSAALRSKLKEEYEIPALSIAKRWISKVDGTQKFLFECYDGNLIESVLMRYKYGNSVCISCQAGCRMGCRFCASTLDGLARNLSASEMLGQVYEIQKATGERVSHVVVMGSGEPFDNYDALIDFITLLTSEEGLNISQRNITVSTCGLVPKIYEFADLKLGVTLAISLHSPTDEMRRELMPIANRYSIEEILTACRCFTEKTGRRVTFEYSLVKGQNDAKEHAEILARL